MKPRLPIEWVERIFQSLHGRFGSRFTNNYKTGELDAQGRDTGIENAKREWSMQLAGMTPERLKAGLSAMYEYAPTCDEFKAKCRPQIHPPITNALTRKFTLEEKEANRNRLHETLKSLNIKSVTAH